VINLLDKLICLFKGHNYRPLEASECSEISGKLPRLCYRCTKRLELSYRKEEVPWGFTIISYWID